MIQQPLFPDIFIDEIKIPHESNHSKYVFSEYVKHDANITLTELAEITGYRRETVSKYYHKYNYRERADTYLSYKIKSRAEYAIHQGDSFDAAHFELSNASLGILRKSVQYIQENFDKFLEVLPPQDIFKFFKDVQMLQKTNLEVGHDSKESLIDNMKYIVRATESGEITDHQAQELMRQLYDEWFKKDDDKPDNKKDESDPEVETPPVEED